MPGHSLPVSRTGILAAPSWAPTSPSCYIHSTDVFVRCWLGETHLGIHKDTHNPSKQPPPPPLFLPPFFRDSISPSSPGWPRIQNGSASATPAWRLHPSHLQRFSFETMKSWNPKYFVEIPQRMGPPSPRRPPPQHLLSSAGFSAQQPGNPHPAGLPLSAGVQVAQAA